MKFRFEFNNMALSVVNLDEEATNRANTIGLMPFITETFNLSVVILVASVARQQAQQ